MARQKQETLDLLLKLQQQAQSGDGILPAEENTAPTWRGLAFRLGNNDLISSIDQVSELVPIGMLTPIPGSVHWVRGIANVRGSLITVVDLSAWFGANLLRIDDESRMLVLNAPGLQTGILVDQVYGLRQFDDDLPDDGVEKFAEFIRPYLLRSMRQGDRLWGVFDVSQLVNEERFLNIGLNV